MRFRARYPAAVLCVVSFFSFLGWIWSNWVLVDVGIDMKYLETEAHTHVARRDEWVGIRMWFGRGWLFSAGLLSLLLVYRWFFVPSRG